jgi:hypothetical protein
MTFHIIGELDGGWRFFSCLVPGPCRSQLDFDWRINTTEQRHYEAVVDFVNVPLKCGPQLMLQSGAWIMLLHKLCELDYVILW